jgi:hypothetical protein
MLFIIEVKFNSQNLLSLIEISCAAGGANDSVSFLLLQV